MFSYSSKWRMKLAAEWDLARDFLIATGGAIGGAAAVFIGQELVARWRRPRLVPSFDTNKHRSVVITVNTGKGPATYIRLCVFNSGKSTAQGCEVAIERLVRTRPTRVEYENDPIPLGWSLRDTDVTHIHARTLRFCDVFSIWADDFHIGAKVQPNYLADALANSFEGAEFEVRLRVSGGNVFPTRQNVVCGWDAGGRNAFARNVST
jgi:hypothetical protein